jgi:hypothetical protein
MLESFFENSRTVGDELWGTALVGGDGSTKRRCRALARCFMALRSNSLAAVDDCTFEKPEAVLENEPPLVGGVDRNCSADTPLIWVEAMPESCFENSRMVDDELWGTALVDGDGSTNTLVKLLVSLVD